jgi:hypothetical protein
LLGLPLGERLEEISAEDENCDELKGRSFVMHRGGETGLQGSAISMQFIYILYAHCHIFSFKDKYNFR